MTSSASHHAHHAAKIADILKHVPKKSPPALSGFIEHFYAKMPAPELAQLDAPRAAAIAGSAFGFAATRTGNAPSIRVFIPHKAEHGYDDKHVVVELLNDDMPFLVDSLTAELTRLRFTIFETIHPILKVRRDKNGHLQGMAAENADATSVESLIHFEISALPEGMTPEALAADLESVLQHIRLSVQDWHAITDKLPQLLAQLEQEKAFFPSEEIEEVKAFLQWLTERNFIFMGYAEYDFYDRAGKEDLRLVPESCLGILKLIGDAMPTGLEAVPPQLRHFMRVPQLIEITKSNRRSMVHRPVPMDYIGLKRFDAKGQVIGEVRLLGLFTSNVYYQSSESIPLLRRKTDAVLTRSDFDPGSHDGKALKAILEFLPRDEIFQMPEDELFDTSMGILALEAKPGVRIFARKDVFERFISAMIFVPRERFSTELRRQIQTVIEKAFHATTSTFATQINDAPLARLHLIVKTTPGDVPEVELSKLESEIARRAYLWSDLLHDALLARHGEQAADTLMGMYEQAFPQSYINRYDSASAVHDIGKIEEARASNGLALELFHYKQDKDGILHLKIYNPNEEIALSDILPMLENAGFRAIEEHPFLVTPQGQDVQIWIRDFKLQAPADTASSFEERKKSIEEALLRVWKNDLENDRFNALVLKAGLSWRQVVMLRAYGKYMKQIGFPYAQASIEQAFNQHPAIAAQIAAYFNARFRPDATQREDAEQQAIQAIEASLAQVSNVADDRILRRYMELIRATLRTNYYQTDQHGAPKPVLSFKFASHDVPELPLPVPYAEIFVYGTRVEGIHLRGGKVARGGLRWSDRPEDFRTEVLGLMKAQMVKNSVIVPVGSKGGFVVKRPPIGGREALMEEGIACYKSYLRGLLDITDTIADGRVIAPPHVVRHDEDDPYLVVAADKGTATFSDIANGISAEYGFWLGDAFASGGSAGYDHKKMAITARGGWVSVTRHFHEMGIDIATTDFTVAGIGDMAGDVFGNGMLLSPHIRLVAAFNHMHIFLDPSPDAVSSFAERKRLFDLPRSSWKDYNPSLISAGGGVFERSAKTIPLSKEAQEMLNISAGELTPDALIRAILLAPVDLLWNGGIGTYVKGEDETHEQVGDRTNNTVRVNGHELRCKVVGEGGNLGFTQKGRIEYARKGALGRGGRINTDAIDNSAGVDCSDHEVNIKIGLSQEVAAGRLSMDARDRLLEAMTEEVAQLVLKDNILQTQAITIAEQQGIALLDSQARLMTRLERQKLLDRAIEFLPGDKAIAELRLARKGLTRPEIAVLLSYSKMALYKELLESSLPDEPYFAADLKRYFPKRLQEEFAQAIATHPLKREIIATVATNSLVNRAGSTFYFDLAEDLDASARDITAAYTLARDAFGLRSVWKEIEQSHAVSVAAQVGMIVAVTRFLEQVTAWLLRHLPRPLDIDAAIKQFAPGIAVITAHRESLHSDVTRKAADKYFAELVEQSVPPSLAAQISGLEVLASAFDIITVAEAANLPVEQAGQRYFALGARLRIGWLRIHANRISTLSHWDRLAVHAMINDLYEEQRRLTAAVISAGGMERWAGQQHDALLRYDQFIDDLKASEAIDLPRLLVALRHLRGL